MSKLYRGIEWQRLRDRIVEEDGGVCQCCGSSSKVSVHHIIPVSMGGGLLDEGNLISTCAGCSKRIHAPHLRYGGGNEVFTNSTSLSKVYNVAILREMLLTGVKTSERDTFRVNFLRRRKIPDGRPPLSKRVVNMARMIDEGRIDPNRLPWVFDFGSFEVCIRVKEDGNEDVGSDAGDRVRGDGVGDADGVPMYTGEVLVLEGG